MAINVTGYFWNYMDYPRIRSLLKNLKNVFIGNASTYYEMDSKKLFIYDEENHQWFEM